MSNPNPPPCLTRRRAWIALRVGLVPTALVAPGAEGQDPVIARCSFDTAAVTTLHTFTIALAAAGADLVPSDGPPEAVRAAEVIASYFVAPSAMSLPLWARVGPKPSPRSGGAPAVGHGLDDFIHITLSKDGRLGDRTLDIRTISADFNEALRRAILRADSAAALPPTSQFLARSGNRITLRLVDTSKVRVPVFPLMQLTIPTIRAETNVRVLKFPSPSYPRNALHAGAADDVEIQYVVNEAGRADADGPFTLLRVRYRPFAEAVIESLQKGTFEPARVRGCPIPMLVHQPFSFAIRR